MNSSCFTIAYVYNRQYCVTQLGAACVQTRLPCNACPCAYRRLHLPVNALAQNMFSRGVKRLSFRCQTLKFSRPNVKCGA